MISTNLCGDLDISRNLFSAGERTTHLMVEVVSALKVVFMRLGHNVRVYATTGMECKVRSDHGDITEMQDIKQLANIVFAAFYASDYSADKTLETLELRGLIPRIDI